MTTIEKARNTKALNQALECYARKNRQLVVLPNNFIGRLVFKAGSKFFLLYKAGRSHSKSCKLKHGSSIPLTCANRFGIYTATPNMLEKFNLKKTHSEESTDFWRNKFMQERSNNSRIQQVVQE